MEVKMRYTIILTPTAKSDIVNLKLSLKQRFIDTAFIQKEFVNDTLRMYKNDDIRMYNFNCITDTIVEVITTCNTYTLLTVHLL